MKRIWKKPELMSPAGYWPQLKTAIEAGADAVYFGLKHFTARATGTIPLAPAQHRALDEAFLREHLSKLGGTPFHLEAVTLDSAEPLFVPVSEVNALRRQVVEQLIALQTSRETPQTYRVVADTLARLKSPVASPTPPQVHVLVRTPEQLEAAL